MSKKLKIIIGIVLGVLVLLGVGIIILINTKWYKETLIRSDLRKMVTEFYTLYYNDNNSDNKGKEFMSSHKDSGLNISLKDMKIYLESRNTTKDYNYKRLEKCNPETTTIFMYPKEPFEVDSVEFKFELDCK
jgi:hypothetical protein